MTVPQCHSATVPQPQPVSRFPGRLLTEAVVSLMTPRVYYGPGAQTRPLAAQPEMLLTGKAAAAPVHPRVGGQADCQCTRIMIYSSFSDPLPDASAIGSD